MTGMCVCVCVFCCAVCRDAQAALSGGWVGKYHDDAFVWVNSNSCMLTCGTWSLIVRHKPPELTQPASVAVGKTLAAVHS